MTKFNKKGQVKNQWFAIRQYRYDTSKNKVVKSTAKRSAPVNTTLSHQERQMLDGIMNSLQQDEPTTLRLIIDELVKFPVLAQQYMTFSSPSSVHRGHTARSIKLNVKVPMTERSDLYRTAEDLGVSNREILRLGIISMAKQIKNDTLKALASGGRRISQDKLAEQWKATDDNAHKEGSLKSLRGAHSTSWEASREEGELDDALEYNERGNICDKYGLWGRVIDPYTGGMDTDLVDQYRQMDAEEEYEAKYADCDPALRRQLQIEDLMDEHDITLEEATSAWDEIYGEDGNDEDLEDLEDFEFFDIDAGMTDEEKAERDARNARWNQQLLDEVQSGHFAW